MRERVQALGGVMEIVSGAARGFQISAWLPVGENR
jgi:signal transduction histidine kinase